MTADRSIVRVLFVLSVAQVIGWGTVGLPAIVGRHMAADLHMDLAAVFGGSSILYVTMGLCAPLLARAFARFGARLVMMAGTLAAVPGFVLLALAHEPIAYFSAWAILGVAGSATLSTAAYIMLNEIAGQKAKGAIGGLMLVTGLSSSIFWPLTSVLSDIAGWRATCLVFAGLMALVCLPFYAFGLPRRAAPAGSGGAAPSPAAEAARPVRRGTFYLMVSAIALNSFVTFGFAAVMIELLKAAGLPPVEAIAFGSALGVIQVSARAIDFLGGGRWDGVTTGLMAGLALPAAMVLLLAGGGAYWSIAAFIILYGLGSGALAVARATIPLVFYDQAAYAKASSHIALPLNLMSALAPPVLVGLLTRSGTQALLGLAIACSCGAWLILFLLARRRPASDAVATG
ncbi:MFS transporter [Phreatobacter stygius]|uniref:MFS transporter n=1 Tax=Phreatobacter stygius TaxID=1940610 RepID=A0A4D7B5L4_9HYPH|nr:MFS transporter [Phreatobacter stygius]